MNNQEMSVPEAMEELERIRFRNPGTDAWRREVQIVLDCVWLQAYEEGEMKVFSGESMEKS
jgi:hypothetical protein